MGDPELLCLGGIQTWDRGERGEGEASLAEVSLLDLARKSLFHRRDAQAHVLELDAHR